MFRKTDKQRKLFGVETSMSSSLQSRLKGSCFTAGGSFDGLAPFSNHRKGQIWKWDITSTQSDC
jgi:hypothetical protein